MSLVKGHVAVKDHVKDNVKDNVKRMEDGQIGSENTSLLSAPQARFKPGGAWHRSVKQFIGWRSKCQN